MVIASPAREMERCSLRSTVTPRSLLMGGVQLDVLSVLDFQQFDEPDSRHWRPGFHASGFQPSRAGA